MASHFSLLEKQILALHFSGSYISNFEFKQIGHSIGIEIDLADREQMLKNLITKAKELHKEAQLFQAIATLIQERIDHYEKWRQTYPQGRPIIDEYIKKGRNTIALLEQKARMATYE
ncbi:MAG: hypothetical protein C6I00_05465 [Nitratiruptor sp.]|nr:hypothetical protein [Nitratiruptor sp.]NPA83548.1 hypothetical protein [Campylobacterota bacterium]